MFSSFAQALIYEELTVFHLAVFTVQILSVSSNRDYGVRIALLRQDHVCVLSYKHAFQPIRMLESLLLF